jgi:hypothetical protein
MKNQLAIDTYTWIQNWMKIAKNQGWGESTPVYLFCHTTSKAFGDMDAVKNGTFRISKAIYDKEVLPLLNLISELIEDTGKEINGSFVKEFIVDIRVKRRNEPKFEASIEDFMKSAYTTLYSRMQGKTPLPSTKAEIEEELNAMYNAFTKRQSKLKMVAAKKK